MFISITLENFHYFFDKFINTITTHLLKTQIIQHRNTIHARLIMHIFITLPKFLLLLTKFINMSTTFILKEVKYNLYSTQTQLSHSFQCSYLLRSKQFSVKITNTTRYTYIKTTYKTHTHSFQCSCLLFLNIFIGLPVCK